MRIYQIDPIIDPRWDEFSLRHPDASVFHRTAWLKALRDTYGYKSLVLTTTRDGQPLKNGMVFCHIKSWLTGARLVSLPFADHCQPLVDGPEDFAHFRSNLGERFAAGGWKYIELRPRQIVDPQSDSQSNFGDSVSFCFHQLDLRRETDEIYRGLHKHSIQQKLTRAEREGLTISHGNSEDLLKVLYKLLLLTRRRHQLPPQPYSWFRNLVRHFGDDAVIWVASKEEQPIAAILVLICKNAVVYKYSCSDSNFHNLGGVPTLIWRAICHAKQQNASIFDFGRSDLDNHGLINFKNRWGTDRLGLTYYRYARASDPEGSSSFASKLGRRALSWLPDSFLVAAGQLLYRHIG
jgi:GNAT acetyltransferase-like protein